MAVESSDMKFMLDQSMLTDIIDDDDLRQALDPWLNEIGDGESSFSGEHHPAFSFSEISIPSPCESSPQMLRPTQERQQASNYPALALQFPGGLNNMLSSCVDIVEVGMSSLQKSRSEIVAGTGNGEESVGTSTSVVKNLKVLDKKSERQVIEIKRSLMQALKYIKLSGGHVLVQVWMPYREADRVFLTTKNQPFVLNQGCDSFFRYRDVSAKYVFPTEKGSHAFPGLPGRVFMKQTPEWTPNVQFYSCHEFLRVKEAIKCDVRGTLAVPVFEPESKSCVAVIELVMNVEKIQYGPEINYICNALQAVNLSLTATEQGSRPLQITQGRQVALGEIQEVLVAVCKTHKLPLAQIWMPQKCGLSSKDAPFCVGDPLASGFRKACIEHALQRGEGLPGRAFTSNQPVFANDVRTFSKDDYPLGHYARMFNMAAAVAIRLRSIHTGTDDYVFELFLPSNCGNSDQQQFLLDSISITMQRVCRSLRTVNQKELEEESESRDDDRMMTRFGYREVGVGASTVNSGAAYPSGQDQQLHLSTSLYNVSRGVTLDEATVKATDLGEKGSSKDVFGATRHPSSASLNGPIQKRRRGTAEKTVCLSVLQQYFAGRLKDAAKSIGVCPTTLKRICRQHGIPRWPSRKINKVNRQLKKLQGVLNSVQGLNALSSSTVVSVGGVHLGDVALGQDATNDGVVVGTSSINLGNRVCGSARPVQQKRSGEDDVKSVECSKVTSTGNSGMNEVAERTVKEEEGLQSCSSPSSSGEPSGERSSYEDQLPTLDDCSMFILKVVHGADTIRFKMPLQARYREVRDEIQKRFYLEEPFTLKYLDDEGEWVMFSCNEDFRECMDIMHSSNRYKIKIMIL